MINRIENDNSMFYEHDDKLYIGASKTEAKLLDLINIISRDKQAIANKISESNHEISENGNQINIINKKLDNIIGYMSLPWYKKLFTKFKA